MAEKCCMQLNKNLFLGGKSYFDAKNRAQLNPLIKLFDITMFPKGKTFFFIVNYSVLLKLQIPLWQHPMNLSLLTTQKEKLRYGSIFNS